MSRLNTKEKYKIMKLLENNTVEYLSVRYHISIRTIFRWKAKFDGSIESLENRSTRPHSKHPNAHSDYEIKSINALLRRNKNIGLNELYGKLRLNYGYKRNSVSLYRFLKRSGYYLNRTIRKPYKPKEYHTPENIGEKMQLDVKYVPYECYTARSDHSERFYQYTIIDEATRQRFIYPYKECNGSTTVDFVIRAIRFFGYIPKIIQTDNGIEFTYTMQTDRLHTFDSFCNRYGIEHKLIRPRTPRHNGKVERSHRNDNERFYRYLKFYNFADLQLQMSIYLKRSNSIPISTLRSSDRKTSYLTPLEKRKELYSICPPSRVLKFC